MAFFCPIRVRKAKKVKDNDMLDGHMKSGLASSITGRITGSNSVETLVRVGLEKEHQSSSSDHCKMIVLHDFSPCVDDELEVKRGQIVTVLYQENDWVYVIRDHTASSTLEDPQTSSTGSSSHASNEGFIPYSYCTPVSSQLADMVIKHKKIPRSDQTNSSCSNNNTALTSINSHMYANNNVMTGSTQHYQMMTNLLTGSSGKDLLLSGNSADSQNHLNNNNNNIMFCNSDSDAGKDLDSYSGAASDIHPFFKNPSGDRYLVLYTFIARDENDVSVERGEFVTVLNMDDPDWFWILRSDGLEGFVPSTFLCALDPETNAGVKKNHQQVTSSNNVSSSAAVIGHNNNNVIGTSVNPGPNSNSINNQSGVGYNSITFNNNTNAMILNNNTNDGIESTTYSNSIDGNSQHGVPIHSASTDTESRFHGDELVMLYDYKADAPDDLNVRRGDWVYADLKAQAIDGWIWAYSPKLKKYGFIPKAYARPPAMTSI